MPSVKIWSGVSWSTSFTNQSTYYATLADDNSNQSPSLQAQIDALDNGTSEQQVTLRLPSGEFRLDDTIDIQNRNYITIEGPTVGSFLGYTDLTGVDTGDSVLVAGSPRSQRIHWSVSGGTGVRLRHIRVRGANDQRDDVRTDFAEYLEAYAAEHGFAVTGAAADVLIESCEAQQVWGDAVYVGGTGSANTNIIVRDFYGRYCGRQSLGVTLVDGCLFEDVDIRWGGRSGLDIEPNHDDHYVWNCTLRRCTMGSNYYPFVIGGSGSNQATTVKNIVLEDCKGLNAYSSHAAILANPQAVAENITVTRHTDIRQRSIRGMQFGNWSGMVTITDSVVTSGPSTPTSYGVGLDAVTADVTITNCTFNGIGPDATSGADELYGVNSTGTTTGEPNSITTCGNTWAYGAQTDGVCT